MVQRYSEQGRSSVVPCHASKSQGEMALAFALIKSTGGLQNGREDQAEAGIWRRT